ncbi:hypothetical protein ACLB90_15720 [Stenotrophomonas sp. LGBM10]|uniref:hypothetical protein n=1 Tax=Stenotrophomonas sp. LGBM10 TaxID=3390038 RepID=UPI00398AF93E
MRMPQWKRVCGSLALALLCAPAAQAGQACDDPVAVARRFQQASVEGLLETPAALLSPGLGALFAGERDCQEREQGICHLDSDPWLDGQDGEIDAPFTFARVAGSAADVATVEVRYAVWGEPYRVLLSLRQRKDGCWGVDDMTTQRGSRLRDRLTGPL